MNEQNKNEIKEASMTIGAMLLMLLMWAAGPIIFIIVIVSALSK